MAVGVPTELGTEKISKLLRQYAVPAIIAMTASSIYNMVDSIFIGQGVGALAISGLALTFPLMNLGAAFGSLVGVGASTTISVLLGQKNYDIAQKVLGNVVVLNLIIGIAYMFGILIFLDEILYFFGASDQTIGYAKDYMEIILYGNCITHMYFGLNAVLRSSGFPKFSMHATILTVVLNTVLDPLFIYVFDWGIRGAAIATILSQAVSLCWQLHKLSDKSSVVHFKRGIYKLKKRIVTDIVSIGMAPFLMNAASCLIVILINKGLKDYGGDLSIGAYGIVNRVVFVFIMIVMGLNQGMQPIAGFNFGAQNYHRLITVLKLTIVCATCITTLGFIVGEFFPRIIVSVFTSDAELIEKSVRGMRLICIFLPLVGMQMVTSNYFQSIGKASKAIFLSLTRQLIFLLPFLIILPQFYGVNGVWLSMPFSDLAASIVAGSLLYNEMKKYRRLNDAK
ncbi:MAG: MATE family efflux transporter [Bacteroidia bacterium]|nr:MATE family efflux transporter [Bacteroidia bacterium]